MADQVSTARIRVEIEGEAQLRSITQAFQQMRGAAPRPRAVSAGAAVIRAVAAAAGLGEEMSGSVGQSITGAILGPLGYVTSMARNAVGSLTSFLGPLAGMGLSVVGVTATLGAAAIAIAAIAVPLAAFAGVLKLMRSSFKWAADATESQFTAIARTRRLFPGAIGEEFTNAQRVVKEKFGIASAIMGEGAVDALDQRITRLFTDQRLARGLRGERDIFANLGITPQALHAFREVTGHRVSAPDLIFAFIRQRERLANIISSNPPGSAAGRAAQLQQTRLAESSVKIFGENFARVIGNWGMAEVERIRENRARVSQLAAARPGQDLNQEARDFKVSLLSLQGTFGHLKTAIATDVTPRITQFMDQFREWLTMTDANGRTMFTQLRNLAGALATHAWEVLARLLSRIDVEAITKFINRLTEWNAEGTAERIANWTVGAARGLYVIARVIGWVSEKVVWILKGLMATDKTYEAAFEETRKEQERLAALPLGERWRELTPWLPQGLGGGGGWYGGAPSAAAPGGPSPAAVGPAAQMTGSASQALAYFQSQGWTRAQAAGIVANLHHESGFRPSAAGDGGRAYGIAQWHPDRQRAIERRFGKSIRQMNFQEQLAAVQWEMTQGPEKAAGDRLRAAQTPQQAGAIVSRYYERPGAVAAEMMTRARTAAQFHAAPPITIAGGTAGGGGATGGYAAPAGPSPYRLVGGAVQPSAWQNLTPEFRSRLNAMLADMPPELRQEAAVAITSGYRSEERQEQLYREALAQGRAHMVARPVSMGGRGSAHTRGEAIDFAGFKQFLDSRSGQWVHANMQRYGLYAPMNDPRARTYEPWHVQPLPNWQGTLVATEMPPPPVTSAGGARPATYGSAIQDVSRYVNLPSGGQMPGTPQGLLVHHTGGQGDVGGVVRTLQQRGLSVQFVIDRDGNIVQIGREGQILHHAGTGDLPAAYAKGGIGNINLEGVEVIAANEADVLPAQRQAVARLLAERAAKFGYDPQTSVWGHGEYTSRKQATEGATAQMIRSGVIPLPQVVRAQPEAIASEIASAPPLRAVAAVPEPSQREAEQAQAAQREASVTQEAKRRQTESLTQPAQPPRASLVAEGRAAGTAFVEAANTAFKDEVAELKIPIKSLTTEERDREAA